MRGRRLNPAVTPNWSLFYAVVEIRCRLVTIRVPHDARWNKAASLIRDDMQ